MAPKTPHANHDEEREFIEQYLNEGSEGYGDISHVLSSGIKPEGFYVYLLIDPRDQAIFYVGKGSGGRVYQHVKSARAPKSKNGVKDCRIIEIQRAGGKVIEAIYKSNLSEDEAFGVERYLIERLRKHGLTNIAGGVVTSRQSSMARAAKLLSHLKSYDVWFNNASPETLELVSTVFGSPRDFYDTLRGEIEELTRFPQVLEFEYSNALKNFKGNQNACC
ncbi:GIY-YIG nuclease family protein [Sulfitobacter sp. OXR-159]|uniref:GIY-YIG nuclease family protein n=1 Tax=Sulfitobacter sp. OXR-159 TaxID=3100174 RepID=UPI002AC9D77A|nr:GIY-YIG nuclease family protein [Sulfitobacter sp. OXR-159]WPZ30747.1 GIY-YIG nuclease family protein [Sulfitobacter sp. OXR-159]WPZ30848.1 GIY-YIG nuclease family protein [Sulfitobacter sp. OXR-159]